jgi:hypothetical protein
MTSSKKGGGPGRAVLGNALTACPRGGKDAEREDMAMVKHVSASGSVVASHPGSVQLASSPRIGTASDVLEDLIPALA